MLLTRWTILAPIYSTKLIPWLLKLDMPAISAGRGGDSIEESEKAVCFVQQQMQSLRDERKLRRRRHKRCSCLWVEPQQDGTNVTRSLRLLSSHTPY
ncbi:hypothetical protein M378DRAFT_749913 [Amanita muscaria Koide BX008]|uniref:Uncharacterized protein n=1 Tax=Amanita muscaria (strain Koide BX008) TaxID=946122 RepID=A0A0C2SHW0_AMAMK|nr:hypothetical protein M378DRAFT_749913 [Amanita muscaria Koide BX008]